MKAALKNKDDNEKGTCFHCGRNDTRRGMIESTYVKRFKRSMAVLQVFIC